MTINREIEEEIKYQQETRTVFNKIKTDQGDTDLQPTDRFSILREMVLENDKPTDVLSVLKDFILEQDKK